MGLESIQPVIPIGLLFPACVEEGHIRNVPCIKENEMMVNKLVYISEGTSNMKDQYELDCVE